LSSGAPSSVERMTESGIPSLTALQQSMVREQLDRIVASSLFRNSKRFPEFLRYTVGRALDRNTEDVKERTIGVEVFGREPNYDTTIDPVVRVTAAAVRKRLTHYYREIGHEHELRIEFARGSYVPEFRFHAEDLSSTGAALFSSMPVASAAASSPPVLVSFPPPLDATASNFRSNRALLWVVIACLALPYIFYFAFQFAANRPTAIDDFWNPVTTANASALICIPTITNGAGALGALPARSAQTPTASPSPARSPRSEQPPAVAVTPVPISFTSAMALSSVSAGLGKMGKAFHVRHVDEANLNDLEDGPVVLIGGFGNRWTMNLDNDLRFDLEHDGSFRYIADRRNPSSRAWEAADTADFTGTLWDYALISRVHNPTTGRVLITIAGLHGFGTQAAAECVLDAACIAAAEKIAVGDWKNENIQIVLQTKVIGGESGEPRVLAAYVW
jgi:hypothetical protein